jgi:hypothetical protein
MNLVTNGILSGNNSIVKVVCYDLCGLETKRARPSSLVDHIISVSGASSMSDLVENGIKVS